MDFSLDSLFDSASNFITDAAGNFVEDAFSNIFGGGSSGKGTSPADRMAAIAAAESASQSFVNKLDLSDAEAMLKSDSSSGIRMAQSAPTSKQPTAYDMGYTNRVLAAARQAYSNPTSDSVDAAMQRIRATKAKGPYTFIDDSGSKPLKLKTGAGK